LYQRGVCGPFRYHGAETCVQIATRSIGDVTVLKLAGRLAVTESPGLLKEAVQAAVLGGARHVVIDLADVHYIDSTRLGELIAAHITVSRKGGRLKLAATPERITEMLTMAGLSDVFERFDSADQAIRSLR
jgi:anti-sigma B factor antagonist